MILTYVDSGVLIYAARGREEAAGLALPFLQDQNREFVTSDYVRLEVIPKSVFHGNVAETEFYNGFFRLATRSIKTSERMLRLAMEEACRTGTSALDAIHIACAVFAGAEELVTSERDSKPIHRTNLVKIVSIFPPDVSLN